MIKAICMDLDGSLLDSNKEISKKTEEGLKMLAKKDIKLILASGRTKSRMKEYALQLGLDTSAGHIIESNGTAIYDFETDQHEVIRRLHDEEVKELFDILRKEQVEILIMGEENCYICLSDGQDESNYMRSGNMEGLRNRKFYYIKDPSEIPEAVNKVCVMDSIERIEKLSLSNDIDEERYWFGKTMETWFEIGPREASKGKALQKILKRYNIGQDEVAVFGDGENDLSMLTHVKYGVAMENALDSVKEACDYTCGSCDNDGIINFLLNMEV